MEKLLQAYFSFCCRLDDLTLNGGQLYLDTKYLIDNDLFTDEYIEMDIENLQKYITGMQKALDNIKKVYEER